MNYEEQREEIKQLHSQLTREEVKDKMEAESEYVLDLDNLPSQDHHWVKRGIILSCEGMSHPNHQSHLR